MGLRRGTEGYAADFTIREFEAKCKFCRALTERLRAVKLGGLQPLS